MDAVHLSFDYICFSDYYDKHYNNLDSISSKYACLDPNLGSRFNVLKEEKKIQLGQTCVFTGAFDRW